MRAVLIQLVDDAILVAVDELTFQRLAVSIVLLLVDEEGTRGIADGVDLHVRTRQTRDAPRGDTLIAGDFYSVELCDTRAVGADVVAHIPRQVLGLDRGSIDAELKALAGDVTDIREDAVREVSTGRRGDLVQKVAGLLLVEVERTRETPLDEAVVKTYVVGSRLLPVDVRIVGSWAQHIVVLVAELIRRRIRAERVEGEVGVVPDTILLTRDTVAETELEVIDPRDILEEVLLIHTPSQRQSGEDTPAVLPAEARRAVGTHCSGEEVAVHEAVVQTAVEGHQRILWVVVLVDGSRHERLVVGVVRRVVDEGLPVLIGVPCHDVDTALQRAKLLDVVRVEVEEEAALALVVSIVRTALIDVGLACLLEGVALPSEGGVLGDDDRTLTRSVVVAEVHVELQLGEEVELIVDLQIADRAEDITDILLLIEESDRVLRSELLEVCPV